MKTLTTFCATARDLNHLCDLDARGLTGLPVFHSERGPAELRREGAGSRTEGYLAFVYSTGTDKPDHNHAHDVASYALAVYNPGPKGHRESGGRRAIEALHGGAMVPGRFTLGEGMPPVSHQVLTTAADLIRMGVAAHPDDRVSLLQGELILSEENVFMDWQDRPLQAQPRAKEVVLRAFPDYQVVDTRLTGRSMLGVLTSRECGLAAPTPTEYNAAQNVVIAKLRDAGLSGMRNLSVGGRPSDLRVVRSPDETGWQAATRYGKGEVLATGVTEEETWTNVSREVPSAHILFRADAVRITHRNDVQLAPPALSGAEVYLTGGALTGDALAAAL